MTIKTVWAVYYSATGSTRRTVQEMAAAAAQALNLPVQELDYTRPEARERHYAFEASDLIFWGSPTYAGRLPNVLLPFLKGSFCGGGAAAVAVVLYGSRSYDDALKELCEVLTANGFIPAAAASLVAEHAFAPALAHGRPDKEDRTAATDFARRMALTLQSTDRPRAISVPGRELIGTYYTPRKPDGEPAHFLKAKPQTDREKCTGCGLCAERCPMGSISYKEPWECSGICIKCQACIKGCPVGAKCFADADFLAHRKMLEQGCTERRENEFYLPEP